MSDEKLSNKLDSFKRSLDRLRESIKEPIKNDRDLAGIIKHFEIALEQAYKVAHELLTTIEFDSAPHSVKAVFTRAFELEWTRDEQTAIEMIKDRNSTVHTYDEEFAQELVGRINAKYFSYLEALGDRFEKEISDLKHE